MWQIVAYANVRLTNKSFGVDRLTLYGAADIKPVKKRIKKNDSK